MEARAQRLEVKADRVVLEAARIAFADLGRMVRWGKNGVRLVESSKLSPDDRAAVAAVQERRHKGQLQGLAIKLHDKNAALVTLCRQLGLFNQQAVSQKPLNALLDGMASVLQRYVDPGRVKEAILELTRIAQDSYERLEAPAAPPDGRAHMMFDAELGVGVVSATVAPGGNFLGTVEPGARALPEFDASVGDHAPRARACLDGRP